MELYNLFLFFVPAHQLIIYKLRQLCTIQSKQKAYGPHYLPEMYVLLMWYWYMAMTNIAQFSYLKKNTF